MRTPSPSRWAAPAVDLSGRSVLVVGGSGGVGEGVVRRLVGDGATVIATGRDESRLHDLAGTVGSDRLRTAVVQALDPGLDEVLRELAAPTGGFDGVVVSVASWGSVGRAGALEPTDEQWTELVDGNLTAVFRLFRALTPLVRPGGAILQLNGMSADIPFPGAAGVALAAAATKSLVRTLAAERQGSGPRVYEVVLGVVRTRARQAAGIDDMAWLDGEQIGGHVAQLVAGTSPLADVTLHYLLDAAAGPQPGPDGS